MSLPPAVYIDDDASLRDLAVSLQRETLLAVDTESNSLYAYRERVCLVQLSTRTADYIIDPLAISDMGPLGQLLADPAIEKVFHAAEYDLICMRRDFGFHLHSLFDTMIAARICGIKAVGLANMLGDFFGVEVDKRHQRDDWARRPLSPSSLAYAQKDTHYLPRLRDRLYEELERRDHLEEAAETFAEHSDVSYIAPSGFDPDGYWHIGRPHSLTRKEMSILRELYLLREALAEEMDQPPFKVLGNQTLVELARSAPTQRQELAAMRGVSPGFVRRSGDRLLAAIERGRVNRLPSPPQHLPPDPDESECYYALSTWRKERARQRDVESDVIISRQALWELARRKPASMDEMRDIRGLGPWRLARYGQELLQVIHTYRNGSRET